MRTNKDWRRAAEQGNEQIQGYICESECHAMSMKNSGEDKGLSD